MARLSHWVICKICGRQFDYEKKGGFYDGNRYTCKSCAKRMPSQPSFGGEVAYPPQRKSWFKSNWKIIFGIFFLIGGFGNIGQDGQAALFGIILGVVLTFAHFYPQLKSKKIERSEKAVVSSEKEPEQKVVVGKLKKCTSCGAKTRGEICEYCGSLLD